MAIPEPEVARADLDAAKRAYEQVLKLVLDDIGNQERFRSCRAAWNLALDAYIASRMAWDLTET